MRVEASLEWDGRRGPPAQAQGRGREDQAANRRRDFLSMLSPSDNGVEGEVRGEDRFSRDGYPAGSST